ncbi:MAG: hypothetical protein ACK4S4_07645 [Pyrinomonadaceae bacterium]
MKKSFSILLSVLSLFAPAAIASGPSVWTVNSRSEVMRGDARGVSIDDNGTITLAPKLAEIFRTEQPYIWSTAVDQSGNIYLGTGAEGRVYKVDTSGRGALLADLAELNVTAIAVGRTGEIFAATSPDGKVYRLDAASGTPSVYFEPKQKYIWSLAVMADGSLAVGTGDGGKIYRVRAGGATPESSLLFDTSETNIVSLAADRRGNLYAGTDPGGLVIRFGADGKPFGVLDSSLREIRDLAVGANDAVYALALAESAGASTAKPADANAAAADAKPVTADKPDGAQAAPAKSRFDIASARSAVYRIAADGGSSVIWTSPSVTAFSIAAAETGGVTIGTSDKGRVYGVSDAGRETLLLQSDAGQISRLVPSAAGMIAAASNPGTLYRIGTAPSAEGTYESPVLDAKAAADWGRIWWRSTGTIEIETRSGNTEKPNETWSSWTTPAASQVKSPKARFLQWRAVLKASNAPPASLSEVSVAFLPQNLAPEVLAIQVLPANVGLVPNPAPQIDPNIELSGLDPATFGIPSASAPPRRVYQRAARSLQWTAEDRNGDKLAYDIYYREVSEQNFRPLRRELEQTFFTIDGQSLADGRYVFKIVARDTPSNPAASALSGERTTDPIDIDNTAPSVTVQNSSASQVIFAAVDRASYITRAEYSVNGGEWITVYPDDRIADSPTETFTVAVPTAAGEYSITLRVFDVNGNAGNARAVVTRR